MVQQSAPAAILCPHALDLRAADRVEQPRHRIGHEQVLATANRDDEVATSGELAEPWPFRGRPRREAWAARLVRILVARLIQARQRAVGCARQQPAVAQERLRLGQRPERPVRRQAAAERPPLPELGQRLHPAILPQAGTRAARSCWVACSPGVAYGACQVRVGVCDVSRGRVSQSWLRGFLRGEGESRDEPRRRLHVDTRSPRRRRYTGV